LRFENLIVAPTIVQPKVPIGVDPKSVLCEFFKVGKCTKGDRCKFSHNIDQARKSEKIDIYTDRRNISEEEEKQEKENDTMDKWDQEKLERVVDEKQGAVNENLKTKIVCKYFLEAIESKKYGWFWECPNGALKCIYQHCLPPGYVLKKEAKKDDDDEEPATVEELIEEERTKLVTRTPLTKALFLKWKEEKRSERDKQAEETKKKRESDVRSGKAMRSGREMFELDPSLFIDEEDVLDAGELEPEENRDEGPIINIDVTGTSINLTITNADEQSDEENGVQSDEEEDGKEEEGNTHSGKEEVDESLFVEDDIPDEIDE